MTDIALDLNKASLTYEDIKIVNNDLALVTNQDEITQNLRQVIATFYSEWFLDTTIGLDYFNQILIKNPDQGKINALLVSAILGTPGVLQLLSYSFIPDFINRKLSVSFSVRTATGIVNYSA